MWMRWLVIVSRVVVVSSSFFSFSSSFSSPSFFVYDVSPNRTPHQGSGFGKVRGEDRWERSYLYSFGGYMNR